MERYEINKYIDEFNIKLNELSRSINLDSLEKEIKKYERNNTDKC